LEQPLVAKQLQTLEQGRTMKWLLLPLLLLIACIPPQPVPGPIPPLPDAGAPDIFTTFMADCSKSVVADQTAKAVTIVPACVEADSGVDDCLVGMTKYFEMDTVACVIVDLNVKLQRKVAMGVADSDQTLAAHNANTWIRNHRLGVRR
jgi:hypothetical protein